MVVDVNAKFASKFGCNRTGVACSRRPGRRGVWSLFAFLVSWGFSNHCNLSRTVAWHFGGYLGPGGHGADHRWWPQTGGEEGKVAFFGI